MNQAEPSPSWSPELSTEPDEFEPLDPPSAVRWYNAWLIHALVGMIRLYQLTLSPWVGDYCRYQPTCSRYGILALYKYGFIGGVWRTAWRIFRCSPWGGRGWDPP